MKYSEVLKICSQDQVQEIPKVTGIYMFKNLKNQKVYIGQACNLKARLSDSIKQIEKGIYHNTILQSAWIKYGGFNGFEIHILEICTKEDLNKKEVQYILDFNSLSHNNGYNISIGGSSSDKKRHIESKTINEFKNRPIAMYSCDGEFVRSFENMTEAAQIMNTTVSRIYSLANSFGNSEFKDNKNRFIYIHDNFYPQRITPKLFSCNNLHLLLYNKQGEFLKEVNSIASLRKELGCTSTAVINALNGTYPTIKGFIVKYKWKEEYPLIITPFKSKDMKNIKTDLGKVSQMDKKGNLINIHKNAFAASKLFQSKGAYQVIMKALIGEVKSAYGFTWNFVDKNRKNESKPVFQSTKILDGFSTCFRQWRANHSSCSLIHGYSISFKVWFEGELDDKNWVQDYGSFKRNGVKEQLAYWFDHTFVAAVDDPHLDYFIQGAKTGVLDLRIIPAVGCERYAELVLNLIDGIVVKETEGRVRVSQVECFENHNNSSIYIRPQ